VKGTNYRPNTLICPLCEAGELRPCEIPARCGSCGRPIEGEVLRTIEQIIALPDALGRHACECGHPEMRNLPDGVFHCPACGSEVIPLEADAAHRVLTNEEVTI
jgi:hypothetical protein